MPQVNLSHNIGDVIADVEDTKEDLHKNLKRTARTQMGAVQMQAKSNVGLDAEWTGNLRTSISLDMDDRGDEITVSVGTDSGRAPYAPFVEFGTGMRSALSWSGSLPFLPADEGTTPPPGFPYDAPTMGPGMVQNIIEWVETKPVIPRDDDMSQRDVGFAIAAKIAEQGTYAHPFLRPAWFRQERIFNFAMRKAVRKTFRGN